VGKRPDHWASPERMAEGRAAMKRRCVDAALRATPDTVIQFRPRTPLGGYACRVAAPDGTSGYEISAPRPFTRRALYVYLHECAHVILGHLDTAGDFCTADEEHEAERWAQDRMRAEGFAVPLKELRRAREYVDRLRRKEKARKGARTRRS